MEGQSEGQGMIPGRLTRSTANVALSWEDLKFSYRRNPMALDDFGMNVSVLADERRNRGLIAATAEMRYGG